MSTKVHIEYELLDRITGTLNKIDAALDGTSQKLNEAENPVRSFGSSWVELTSSLISAQAIMKAGGMVFDFAKGSVMASAQIEQYKTTLVNMLGTQEAANKRMAEYQDIAQKTPFELQQVVDAGNQLQALGKYSRENITLLGDLASASGKPMEQAMSAYAKLVTGQKGIAVDMFRDLMITADDWQKATGKGISKNGELLASTTELANALPKILAKKGFAGMMDVQSKTTMGQISNLKDAWFQMSAAVGDRFRGTTNSMVDGLTSVMTKIQEMAEIDPIDKIKQHAFDVNNMVAEMTNINTPYERRLELYNELKKIQPDIIANYNLEKNNIDAVNKALDIMNRKTVFQIALEQDKKKVQEILDSANKYKEKSGEKMSDVNSTLARMTVNASGLTGMNTKDRDYLISNISNISQDPSLLKKAQRIVSFVEGLKKNGKYSSLDPKTGSSSIDKLFKETDFNSSNIKDIILYAMQSNDAYKAQKNYEKKAKNFQDALNKTYSALGIDINGSTTTTEPPEKTPPTGNPPTDNPPNDTKIPTLNDNNTNGGGTGRAQSITINVDKMIDKIEIHSSVKEATEDIEKECIQAITRALNSANGN